MDRFSSSLICCLCNYRAKDEFHLEFHIDESHTDIFKQTSSNSEKVAIEEFCEVPVEKSVQETFSRNFDDATEQQSARRRSRRNKESLIDKTAELKRISKGPKNKQSLTEKEIKRTFQANPQTQKTFETETRRGKKRPSINSDDEPCSKRVSETSTTEEKPVLQATSFIEALDALRQEVNLTKGENAKLKEDLRDYRSVQKELKDLKNSYNHPKKHELKSLKGQVNDLQFRNTDLEEKLIKMTAKLEVNKSENGTLKSKVSSLEQDVEIEKKHRAKDLEELAEAKLTATTLYNGILKKTSELAQTNLSLERLDLEMKKCSTALKTIKEGQLQVYKKGFDFYNCIKDVFKQVFEKDSSFCANDSTLSDSFESLDDEEIAEMICSVIEDAVESKRLHFSDIESSLQQMAELEKRKNGYKSISKQLAQKLKSQSDTLKSKMDEMKQVQKNEERLNVELKNKAAFILSQNTRLNETNKSIENIKRQKNELHAEVLNLKREIENEQSKEVKYLITIAELRSECLTKGNMATHLKQKLFSSEMNNKDLAEMITKLKAKMMGKDDWIEKAQARILKHEQKESLLKQEVNILKDDFNMKVSMMTAMHKSKQKLEVELQKWKSNSGQIQEKFLQKEKEFRESLEQHNKTVLEIESTTKTFVQEKESELKNLISELADCESIMTSMRKAIDQKSVQIKNLETRVSEVNEKFEAKTQENVRIKKDLAWAKSHCSELNLKVKSLQEQASVPEMNRKTFSRSDKPPLQQQESSTQIQAIPKGTVNDAKIKQEQVASNCNNTEKVVVNEQTRRAGFSGLSTSSIVLSSHLPPPEMNCVQPNSTPRGLRLIPLSQLQAPARLTRLSKSLASNHFP